MSLFQKSSAIIVSEYMPLIVFTLCTQNATLFRWNILTKAKFKTNITSISLKQMLANNQNPKNKCLKNLSPMYKK